MSQRIVLHPGERLRIRLGPGDHVYRGGELVNPTPRRRRRKAKRRQNPMGIVPFPGGGPLERATVNPRRRRKRRNPTVYDSSAYGGVNENPRKTRASRSNPRGKSIKCKSGHSVRVGTWPSARGLEALRRHYRLKHGGWKGR